MDKRILNLTQHCATEEQVADGVIEPSTETKEIIQCLLTFDKIPTKKEIDNRANVIANLAVKESDLMGGSVSAAMIGGAPYLMGMIECGLIARDITPLYSFMENVAVAEKMESGGFAVKSAFKHVGFVSAR